jgi:hypothetical protein
MESYDYALPALIIASLFLISYAIHYILGFRYEDMRFITKYNLCVRCLQFLFLMCLLWMVIQGWLANESIYGSVHLAMDTVQDTLNTLQSIATDFTNTTLIDTTEYDHMFQDTNDVAQQVFDRYGPTIQQINEIHHTSLEILLLNPLLLVIGFRICKRNCYTNCIVGNHFYMMQLVVWITLALYLPLLHFLSVLCMEQPLPALCDVGLLNSTYTTRIAEFQERVEPYVNVTLIPFTTNSSALFNATSFELVRIQEEINNNQQLDNTTRNDLTANLRLLAQLLTRLQPLVSCDTFRLLYFNTCDSVQHSLQTMSVSLLWLGTMMLPTLVVLILL